MKIKKAVFELCGAVKIQMKDVQLLRHQLHLQMTINLHDGEIAVDEMS
jgi:hypothetical protein